MNLSSFGLCSVGRRSNNEDALCDAPQLGLFVVADGLGGYEGGEIASSLTVAALRRFVEDNRRDPEGTWPIREAKGRSYEENLLVAATVVAHREIAARREGILSQMGSTVVAALVHDTRLIVAHVGGLQFFDFLVDGVSHLRRCVPR